MLEEPNGSVSTRIYLHTEPSIKEQPGEILVAQLGDSQVVNVLADDLRFYPFA